MNKKTIAAFLCTLCIASAGYAQADVFAVRSYAQVSQSSADHEHTYDKTVIKEPDCENSGEYYFKCSGCNEDYYEYPAAAGHKPGEWIIDKQPAFGEKGSKHKECGVCGKVLERSDIPALTKNISDAEIRYTTRITYTGKAIMPAVIVKSDGVSLKKGVDYTVQYYNNVNVGTAQIVIKGAGNYTGSVTKSFTIAEPVMMAPTGFTSYDLTQSSVSIKWNRAANATGYKLQSYSIAEGRWVTVDKFSAGTLSHTRTAYRPGTNIHYRIQSYKIIGSKVFYSGWTYHRTCTIPADVKTVRCYSVTSSGYTIKWTKAEGADFYKIFKFNYNTGKYEKYTLVNGTSLEISGQPSSQRSAYLVQSVKKRLGKYYYSKVHKVKYTTRPDQVLNVRTDVDRKTLTVSWDRVKNANGYEVYYNSRTSGKSVLLGKVSSGAVTRFKTENLPSGKNYYVKVRALSTTPDIKVAGACSDNVRVRVFNDKSYSSILAAYRNASYISGSNLQGFRMSDYARSRLYNSLTCLGGSPSFLMLDLDSGAMIGYNAKSYLGTASTVKMPYMLYCLKQMEDGSPLMDKLLTYNESDYSSGSGIIKNYSFGTKFSIRECMQYIFDYSDNCGYYMLQDYFGMDGYNKYIASIGCRATMTAWNRWGFVSAVDSAKEWIHMYKYIYSGRYADFVRNGLATSTASNFRIGLNGKYTVYSKCGWTDYLHHDTAVVEAEHPYVLICLTDRVSASRLQEVARAADAVHDELWNCFER